MTVDTKGTPVVGATVNTEITGPNNFSLTLTSNPSNSEGVAEAKWKTVAPTKKNSGTMPGPYTATVTNVIAAGYIWNNTALNADFSINAK